MNYLVYYHLFAINASLSMLVLKLLRKSNWSNHFNVIDGRVARVQIPWDRILWLSMGSSFFFPSILSRLINSEKSLLLPIRHLSPHCLHDGWAPPAKA